MLDRRIGNTRPESPGPSSFLQLEVGDKQMHCVTVKDGEKLASVWYDSDEFPNPPKKGDVAEVEGHFDSSLSPGGMPGPPKRWTSGIANKIKVTQEAP